MKTRNKIFIGVVIFEVLFIILMQYDFARYNAIPDTLCTCVIGCGGVMTSITGGMSIVDLIMRYKNKDESYEEEFEQDEIQ